MTRKSTKRSTHRPSATCGVGAAARRAGPASAQGILLLRDTETERALRSYEEPLLKAGGLDPSAVKLYLVNDNEVNAFVAEGQNMFVFTGIIMFAHNANELKGVMAHETGHMVAGHLSRSTEAIQKATIPMLLSLVVGIVSVQLRFAALRPNMRPPFEVLR